jgi:eukaryotic-like serine/threonine-protein kinase
MPTPRTKAALTPDSDLRGQLAGEYRILRQIGAGGFGTVYEAEHPVLKRKAAVKVLHAGRTVDAGAVQRFFAEAQAATQIRHRHIVDIFSFGKLASGQHFYAMDLLDGAPLDRYLDEKKRLEPEVALPLLRPVADALDAMHAKGLVHRDVKPANIFLSWESNGEVVPKLLDFGLVKLLAESPINTASGVPMGTPYYMSPEQCRGEKIDARSDVYAFGVICHELLCGDPPFSGDTPTAVLIAHLTTPPPRLSELTGLPPELDAPVLHMLEKDRDNRPSSVGAAFSELEAAARQAGFTIRDGLPRLPRPSAPPQAEGDAMTSFPAFADGSGRQEPPRQRSGLIWAVGVLLLLLGAGSLYSLLEKDRAGAEPGVTRAASADADRSATAAHVVPSPAPPAASSARPEYVEITLKGAPDGATIVAFDKQIGETPAPVRLPAGEEAVELTVVAPGYRPKTVKVVPSRSQELSLTLTRVTAPPKKTVSKDLEDPF